MILLCQGFLRIFCTIKMGVCRYGGMKKLLLTIALLLPSLVWAFDFQVSLPGGNTLYFDTVDGGAKLVYPNTSGVPSNGWVGYSQPTGSMVIPSTVQHDGRDYTVVEIGRYALYDCRGITSLTVPEGVTTIGNSAFYYCSGMTELRLPSTLLSIGSQIIGYCDALTDIWIDALTPPATSNSFYGALTANITVHVPYVSYQTYSTTAPWSNFGSVETDAEEFTITALPNNPLRGTVLGGGSYAPGTLIALQANAAEGCFFACWSDGDTVNPRALTVTEDRVLKGMFFEKVHDTMNVTVAVHDTVTNTVHDTTVAILHVHDTVRVPVVVHDTVSPEMFGLQVLSADRNAGIGVGSAMLPAGTTVEICALPLEGYRFASWTDGNTDNPRTVTVMDHDVYMATFSNLGIRMPNTLDWTAIVDGKCLKVNGGVGESLRVFDAQGRRILSLTTTSLDTSLMLPSAGVYLVQLGDGPAKKIIID